MTNKTQQQNGTSTALTLLSNSQAEGSQNISTAESPGRWLQSLLNSKNFAMNFRHFIGFSIFLSGCVTTYQPVYKEQKLEDLIVTIQFQSNIPKQLDRTLVHVDVKGTNFRYFYMFYDQSVKKLETKLTRKEFKQHGSSLFVSATDSSYSSKFTHYDSLIFSVVRKISDSLSFGELEYLNIITGFSLEKKSK